MSLRAVLSTVLLTLCLASSGRADVLVLKDGRRLTVTKVSRDGDLVRFRLQGVNSAMKAEDIIDIISSTPKAGFKDGVKKPGPAEAKKKYEYLASRSARSRNAAAMLAGWRRFLADFPKSPHVNAAREQCEVWQKRCDGKMELRGGQWLPPSEFPTAASRSIEFRQTAIAAIKDGRLESAAEAFEAAKSWDRGVPGLKYVEAMLLLSQSRPAPAKALAKLQDELKRAPQDRVLLIDAGWAAMQCNRVEAAVQLFARACHSATGTDQENAANNLGNALQMLSEKQRRQAGVKDAIAAQEDVEVALTARLAEQGQARWGDSRISMDEKKSIEATNRKLKEQIRVVEASLAASESLIASWDTELGELRRELYELDHHPPEDCGDCRHRERIALQRVGELESLIAAERAKCQRLAEDRAQLAANFVYPSWSGQIKPVFCDAMHFAAADGEYLARCEQRAMAMGAGK